MTHSHISVAQNGGRDQTYTGEFFALKRIFSTNMWTSNRLKTSEIPGTDGDINILDPPYYVKWQRSVNYPGC